MKRVILALMLVVFWCGVSWATFSPTVTPLPTPTPVCTPLPFGPPMVGIQGNITTLGIGNAANQRVSYKWGSIQNPGTSLIPGGSGCSTFTDQYGNLPAPNTAPCTCFPQNAYANVTIGSGQPQNIQFPQMNVANLDSLMQIAAAMDPVVSELDLNSCSGFSVTNPPTGTIGPATLQCAGGGLLPGVTNPGDFLVTNAAATAWQETTLSGDVKGSLTVPGKLTVNTVNGTGAMNTVVNAVTQFQATADGRRVTDGICNGTTAVTSNQANTTYGGFSSVRDVGKNFTAANPTSGALLVNTTIASVTNSTTVVLAATCTSGSNAVVGWGTDNTTPGQSAIDAIEINSASGISVGGAVYWPRPAGAEMYYYFATTTGLLMTGSVPTIASKARPVSFIGDPGSAQGPDLGPEDTSTFFFPAIPAVLPNVAATTAFLNYAGAVGCLSAAKVQDIGFEAYTNGLTGLGPVAISVVSADGLYLGTPGHRINFGPLGGGIQFVNSPNVPQCASADTTTNTVAGFTEANKVNANFEYASQPIRYLVTVNNILTTTTGNVTFVNQPSSFTINVASTTNFPVSTAGIFEISVLNYNGGTNAGFFGAIIACTGHTSTTFTGCYSGVSGTINIGGTIAASGSQSFNGTGCEYCYINQYNTPAGIASIYFGPNTEVYNAPMNVAFFSSDPVYGILMQDDAPGTFGVNPFMTGTITGEGGGWLATGGPVRLDGTNQASNPTGTLWAANYLASLGGNQRNLIPNSEMVGTTGWTAPAGWTFGGGVQPDGGNGALLTAPTPVATQTAIMGTTNTISVDGMQVMDAATAVGDDEVASNSAGFTTARDLYKYIQIPGAGPVSYAGGSNGTVIAQIVAVENPTHVKINYITPAAVSGATVKWGQIYSLSAYMDCSNVTLVNNGPDLEVTDGSGTLLAASICKANQPAGRFIIAGIIFGTNAVKVRFSPGGGVIAGNTSWTVAEPMLEAAAFPMAYVPSAILFPSPTPIPTATIPIGAFATPGATPQVAGLSCTSANNGQLAIANNLASCGYLGTPVPTATAGVQANTFCHGSIFSWLCGG